MSPEFDDTTVDIAAGVVTLPQFNWIPNIDQITDSAAGLLAVIDAALNEYGLAQDFERKLFTHGDLIPVPRTEDPTSQLIVAFTGLELGNAGQKQFQFAQGAIGMYAHMVGAFTIEMWVPWPLPTGGIAPMLAQAGELMAATITLNQTGWITFSALRALSLAGITTDPPVTPIVQDNIIVGPLTPVGPLGGMAGWKLEVQLQYD